MAELPVTAVIEWPLHPLPYHNFLEVSSSFIWKGALVTLKHRNYNNPYLRVVKYRFFWSKLFKQVHTTHKPTDRTWHQQMNSFYKSEILTEFWLVNLIRDTVRGQWWKCVWFPCRRALIGLNEAEECSSALWLVFVLKLEILSNFLSSRSSSIGQVISCLSGCLPSKKIIF